MTEPSRASRPWGLLRTLLGPVATPVHASVVARRNARFDRGDGVRRASVPVISVGNLTVGGTGKTPMVQWLARALAAAGRRPAIAMRGYKSRDGVSDEAEVYRASLPGVPVLVNPDRCGAIAAALRADPGAFDCVVLDDGFQHRQLARDLDIVLIDAKAGTLSDRLLPAGDLREPVASLARAGIVVFTHCADEHAPVLPVRLRSPAIITTAEHDWVEGDPSASPHGQGPDNLANVTRALAVCGIGRPERFFARVRQRVGDVRTIALPDHDAFSATTCQRIVSDAMAFGASTIIMTEKDWVKARHFAWPSSLRVVVPKIRLRIRDGEAVTRAVLAAIQDAETAGRQTGE